MPWTRRLRLRSTSPADQEADLALSPLDLNLLRVLLIWPLLVWATVIFLLL